MTSQYTPQGFNGIFYDTDSGSEEMYRLREDFVDSVRNAGNGLFLSLGAHIDWLVNDDSHLADVALAKARAYWPDEDWQTIDTALSEAHRLISDKPEKWRHEVFGVIRQASLPANYYRPADFVAYFLDMPVYDLLYAARAGGLGVIKANGGDQAHAALAMVTLHLNGATELLHELESAFPYFWPDVEVSRMTELYAAADKAKARGGNSWTQSLSMTIELAIRGYAAIDVFQLFPALNNVMVPVEVLPDTFEHYFVPREFMATVYAKGDDAITAFYHSGMPLTRMVQILVVLDLNGMTGLRDQLESAAELLYMPDMAKIRGLYPQIRQLKEQLGELWMNFAVATIDMAVTGHADINWRYV